MNKYAVIVAGGKGARMASYLPKQFLLLNGKPVLYYTVDTFLKAYEDLKVILVVPEGHIREGQRFVDTYFTPERIDLIKGGETRFHSVQCGLAGIKEEGIIFVHDGVRCLLSADLITRCYEAAVKFGTAIPVTAAKDSLRMLTASGNQPLDRDSVKLVQTPQTFQSKILLRAYNTHYKHQFTDEANVVEASGISVHLIEGEATNIKITEPFDLLLAERILHSAGSIKTL